MAKATTPTKPLTKTELLANIAAATELPKTQVAAVLEALGAEIQKSLSNKGAGADHDPRPGEDREEEGPGPQGREGRAQPVQARRTDGPSRQARLQQGQGAGLEAAQGHGEVAVQSPVHGNAPDPDDLNWGRSRLQLDRLDTCPTGRRELARIQLVGSGSDPCDLPGDSVSSEPD